MPFGSVRAAMLAVKRGIQGILVGPTAITTSTASTATAYSNQRKIDRTSNGVLWAMSVHTDGAADGIADLSYSTDDGATWTFSAYLKNGSTGTAANYTRNGSFFIDQDDYAHVVFKDNSNGYIYYRRGTPNAGRTAWTWSAALKINTTSTTFDYPDIIAFRNPGGSGWTAVVVASYISGSTNVAVCAGISITAGGVVSIMTSPRIGSLSEYEGAFGSIGGSYAASTHTFPSIDFNHTGDGKTVAGGTPHLYVAWSAGATGAGKGIRFKKATYSGGSWTWGTEREIDSTRYVSAGVIEWVNCLFDGTRVIIGGWMKDSGGAGSYDLILHERDAADTTTTLRTLVDSGSAATWVKSGAMSYDANGNVYLIGVDETGANGTRVGHYFKWTRATATLGSAVVYDSTLNNTPYASVKRGYSNNRIEFIYTDGTASPYSVKYGGIK